jgi:hypothetical protein
MIADDQRTGQSREDRRQEILAHYAELSVRDARHAYMTMRCYGLFQRFDANHEAPTCIGATEPSRCLCPCHDDGPIRVTTVPNGPVSS